MLRQPLRLFDDERDGLVLAVRSTENSGDRVAIRQVRHRVPITEREACLTQRSQPREHVSSDHHIGARPERDTALPRPRSHEVGACRDACLYCAHGPSESVLERPEHPYTRALIAATPRIDRQQDLDDHRSAGIGGAPPDPAARPEGCSFAPRCPNVHERCRVEPALLPVAPDHAAACWLVEAAPVGRQP